jgi:hypothetical protein
MFLKTGDYQHNSQRHARAAADALTICALGSAVTRESWTASILDLMPSQWE